jgi:uncharacterized protein (TIGR02217 family)
MYAVAITERSSGVERRNRSWSRPLHRYTATVGPRVEAEVQEALEFYHAVGGRAYGFRFKDSVDYKSCRVSGTPTAVDQPLEVLADSPEYYQMVKRYTAGTLSQSREIYKPVQGTILVADAGVAKVEGVDYTVNYARGTVDLLYAPAGALTWGGQFDVPVRFDSEFPVEILNLRIQSATFTLRELQLANL